MNAEKLSKMQAQVRIGGKGTARRKKKVVHRSVAVDDKKLQSSLKKLTVNTISGVEEVNMIKDNGSVIHFTNPKVQASGSANTFAITGLAETKKIEEMVPGILDQLGPESVMYLRQMAAQQLIQANAASQTPQEQEADEEEEDIPQLVENFDEPSKLEVV